MPPQDLGSSKPSLEISTYFDAQNVAAAFQGGFSGWALGSENGLPSGIKLNLPISLTPVSSSGPILTFHFQGYNANTREWGEYLHPEAAEWRPETRSSFASAIAPFAYSAAAFICALMALLIIDRRFRQVRKRAEQQLLEIRTQAAARPGETHFAWESARIKLEAYFDRNLLQVNLVFWFAVFVMAVGFGFVLAGVVVALKNPSEAKTAALPAAAGIITQFIGATFMVIYRSTMKQANEFMSVLERINTVGMAVHELDRIPDQQEELKNQVRAHLVQALVGSQAPLNTSRPDDSDNEAEAMTSPTR
jgi:hypothetical protein